MLYEESLWFKKIIQKYGQEGKIVLNIGSSTKEFIENEQPYIKTNLLDQLTSKNCVVKNIDLKQADGVDLVGDVTNPAFIAELKQLNASMIICSNLLEHLSIRKEFCEALVKIMNKETLLIISVPYSFPYHEDPIDTMFRPNLSELKNEFNGLKMIEGEIVDCGGFYEFNNKKTPKLIKFTNFIKILLAAGISYLTNKEKFKRLEWNFKTISATCAIYQLD